MQIEQERAHLPMDTILLLHYTQQDEWEFALRRYFSLFVVIFVVVVVFPPTSIVVYVQQISMTAHFIWSASNAYFRWLFSHSVVLLFFHFSNFLRSFSCDALFMAMPLFIYILICLCGISPKSIAHAGAFTQFVALKVRHAFSAAQQIIIRNFVVNAYIMDILCALFAVFSRLWSDRRVGWALLAAIYLYSLNFSENILQTRCCDRPVFEFKLYR